MSERAVEVRVPDVSVLIVSWHTCELTAACLDSLTQSIDDDLTYESVVVDNGSTDGSVELLRGRDDVELVENGENRGYAIAVNQAFARARGELVLLLNSDIEFEPGSLSVLARFLCSHPQVAGVGPLYLNPDGSPQQHHFRLPSYGMFVANTSSLLRRLPPLARSVRRYRMLDVDFSAPLRVEQPSASCLLLRRSALPPHHILDERFPIYFNDVELAYRLAESGQELWMTPEARVRHVHGASTRLLGGSLRRQHLGSLIRYLRRTQSGLRVALYQALVLLQKLSVLVLRRPDALPLRELMPALRGDPGPLPQAPRAKP